MDIISYGIAGKAAKSEKATRNDVLGSGVEGSFPHTKGRIDGLENALQGVVEQANKLIVNDAVNVMKAHAKLNSVAKTMKYKMQNMVFDDLLDLSGIDTTKSSGYTHDAVNGLLSNGTIITKAEIVDVVPTKIILTVEEFTSEYSNNLIPIMTSNTSPSGIITQSSVLNNDINFAGWKAFNDVVSNSGDSWVTANSITTGWLQYQFPISRRIGRYTIQCSTNSAETTRMPKSWTFEGSNDGNSWDILDSRLNEINWSASEKRTYEFSNNNSYQYYKISITANNGGNVLIIGEMEIMEIQSSAEFKGIYSISRDNGVTWEFITPDTLFYFTDSISPLDSKLCLKAELPSGTQLLNYALTWA